MLFNGNLDVYWIWRKKKDPKRRNKRTKGNKNVNECFGMLSNSRSLLQLMCYRYLSFNSVTQKIIFYDKTDEHKGAAHFICDTYCSLFNERPLPKYFDIKEVWTKISVKKMTNVGCHFRSSGSVTCYINSLNHPSQICKFS